MYEIKLTVSLDRKLQQALEQLTQSFSAAAEKVPSDDVKVTEPAPTASVQPAIAPNPQPAPQCAAPQPAAPAPQPVAPAPARQMMAPQPLPPYQQPPAPQFMPQQPPTGLPTAAPAYTQDQLARAAALLADRSPQDRYNVQSLMSGKYGVQMITAIPPEQYPAFAADLRQLGAQI